MKTRILIHRILEILNMMKGFEAGYSTANSKAMLVKKDGIVYKVEFTELGEGKTEDYFDEL